MRLLCASRRRPSARRRGVGERETVWVGLPLLAGRTFIQGWGVAGGSRIHPPDDKGEIGIRHGRGRGGVFVEYIQGLRASCRYLDGYVSWWRSVPTSSLLLVATGRARRHPRAAGGLAVVVAVTSALRSAPAGFREMRILEFSDADADAKCARAVIQPP